MRDLRPFARSVRARYRLARGFCGVPRHRALKNAVSGAFEEIACEAVTGHDYIKHPDGRFLCDFCECLRKDAA